MLAVIFIAPFNLPVTMKFVAAIAALPDVRLGLVSQEPLESFAPELRRRLTAFERVADGLDVDHLEAGVKTLARRLGGVDRLLGTLEQLQVQLGTLRDRLGIDGMGEAAARNFRDKARMKDVLQRANVPCARHRKICSAGEGWAFALDIGYPLILKPPDAAAAKGTFRVTDAETLHHALTALRPTPERPAVGEEFITGPERSFETVTIRGKPVWFSSTLYDPPPLHVLENPWIQWTVLLPREEETAETRLARPHALAALQALGMGTGLSHMEWFRRDRPGAPPVAISEVGARPPGAQIVGLNSHAHGVDFYDLWARLVVFERFEAPPRKYAAGVAFFRGQGKASPGARVVALHGVAEAQRELGGLVVDVKLPQVGQPRAESYEGEGFAILRHPDTEVVARGLRRLISLVRVELG